MLRRAALTLISLAACGGSPKPAPTAATPASATPAHHGHHGPSGDHDFSDAAAWAKVFDDPARDAWQKPDEVVALLGALPGQIIADVGAGTGYFERYLSRAVGGAGKVLALDDEPAMITYLQERAAREMWPNVVAQVVTAGDPALPIAGVDRILVVDTWHHLPDRPRYARALADALRPGGAIAIVDFTGDALLGPPKAARIAPEAVVADLTAAGLKAVIADESLPHQYVVIGRKPTGHP
jgi:predicted methyltransferase